MQNSRKRINNMALTHSYHFGKTKSYSNASFHCGRASSTWKEPTPCMQTLCRKTTGWVSVPEHSCLKATVPPTVSRRNFDCFKKTKRWQTRWDEEPWDLFLYKALSSPKILKRFTLQSVIHGKEAWSALPKDAMTDTDGVGVTHRATVTPSF